MTFIAAETSSTGLFSPIELYLFTYQGNGTKYTYTSGQEPVSYNGDVYLPTFMKRGDINTSNTEEGEELPIEVNRDNPLALFFFERIPLDSVTFTITRYHAFDPDDEKREIYTGVVKTVTWRDDTNAQIITNSISNFLDRFILRMTHQSRCNHTIYDQFCRLDRALYEETAVITAIEDKGLTVVLDAMPVFPGGFEGIHDDAHLGGTMRLGQEFATVIGQDTANLKLSLLVPIPVLMIGSVVSLAPGCQGERTICADNFVLPAADVLFAEQDPTGSYGNSINYLGFPDLPTKNPVGSTLNGATWGSL
ncbi:MAG: hypothetical protein COB09_18485 [Thalassobium sp.]|nr:MAG: hypothetical protein COB09_18485 [Thalassobium sp.]